MSTLTYVPAEAGQVFDLGIARMRLLATADESGRGFSIAEFRGDAGSWTVPHVHENLDESFYVIDGGFTFTVGQETIGAAPGDYIVVPKGTPHVLGGCEGGGSLLCMWSPGGLEKMFVELSQLPPDAIRDPATRAAISARHDSVPVESAQAR